MTEEQKLEFMNYLIEKENMHFLEFNHNDDIKMRTAHKIVVEVIMDIRCAFDEIIQR